jgi:hypothetical protein
LLNKQTFDKIKEKFGHQSSWAVWAEVGDTPKSNMGDLTIFESDEILKVLNPNVILVGMNISKDIHLPTFSNFHPTYSTAQDYKTRFALKDTELWGGYMTDILKDYPEMKSTTALKYARNNPEYLEKCIDVFRDELETLYSVNPLIIAFGNDAYTLLKENLPKLQIVKVPHYSSYISLEDYRKSLLDALDAYREHH